MATVSHRDIVDAITRNSGYYPGDEHLPPVVLIVEYENQWNGGLAWGLVYEHDDPLKYHSSAACINPRVIWERPC